MGTLAGLRSVLFLVLFIAADVLLAGTVAVSSLSDDTPSAYQVLESYDLPIGLLPKGVSGYELDRETGKFKAYLNGTCTFTLEGSYQLRYRSTISGYISKGRLRELNGVSVKVLLFWLNIVEVARNEGELEFSVGIASASFPIGNFAECPQCGCGLDCVGGPGRGSGGRPFLSSS